MDRLQSVIRNSVAYGLWGNPETDGGILNIDLESPRAKLAFEIADHVYHTVRAYQEENYGK